MSTTLKAIAAGNTNVDTKWQEITTTPIVSCSNTNTLITLTGDVTATYGAGIKFTLVGTVSALNDGAYVVSSSTLNGGNTDITPTVAPAANEASETGTSSINRVPVSTDEIDLNGKSMVQAGGDFTIAAIVDVATGGLFTITDTFTVTGAVTDAALYCNATVDTISISDWNYSGAGAALDVGASGNITTISSSSGLDMTSSTGSALTNDNGGTIGTFSVNISNGNSSSAYMIENTGAITTISGYIQAPYGIHNNDASALIGDISDTSGYFYCSYIDVYNESGTISDISGWIKIISGGGDKVVYNKGAITTITGLITADPATYALYNDGGTIGDITGTYANAKGILSYSTGGYGIYNTNSGTIGDVASVYMANATYGVYIDSGSIGDVTITNNSNYTNPSYGLYNAGCSTFGYLTIDGSTNYGTSIYHYSGNSVTYTGSVSGYYYRGFYIAGSNSGVIVDVDFSGTASDVDVYDYNFGSGCEFTGTSSGGGGYTYGAVYIGGYMSFSGDITNALAYGLYLPYGATASTIAGTVTTTSGVAGIYNLGGGTISTNIVNSSSYSGLYHAYQGGTYSGTLTNTGSGDGIQINGDASYLDEISGIVTSTSGTPVNIANRAYGVRKISGTVSYTPAVTNLSAANIKKDTVILGVTGTLVSGGGQHSSVFVG